MAEERKNQGEGSWFPNFLWPVLAARDNGPAVPNPATKREYQRKNTRSMFFPRLSLLQIMFH